MNVEQIVSQNVSAEDAGSIHIYTYVADEEGKEGASPRCGSASASVNLTRRASAHSDSNPISVVPDRTPQSKNSNQDSSQGFNTSPRPSPFTAEHPHITQPSMQYPGLQTQSAPLQVVQNVEKSFSDSPQAVLQDSARMNAGIQNSFSPLASVPEEYQTQGQSHVHSGHNMVDFRDESGIMDARMVEGIDVWWNQPLGDSIMNQWPEGGGLYQFERFPFGV